MVIVRGIPRRPVAAAVRLVQYVASLGLDTVLVVSVRLATAFLILEIVVPDPDLLCLPDLPEMESSYFRQGVAAVVRVASFGVAGSKNADPVPDVVPLDLFWVRSVHQMVHEFRMVFLVVLY